jgi:hypothetical protein
VPNVDSFPIWLAVEPTCFRNQFTLPLAGGSDAVASGEGPGTSPSPALSGRPSQRAGESWNNNVSQFAFSKHVHRGKRDELDSVSQSDHHWVHLLRPPGGGPETMTCRRPDGTLSPCLYLITTLPSLLHLYCAASNCVLGLGASILSARPGRGQMKTAPACEAKHEILRRRPSGDEGPSQTRKRTRRERRTIS